MQLDISKSLKGEEEGMGSAYAALAAAHQGLGNTSEAIDCLQQFLSVAETTGNKQLQAEACTNLVRVGCCWIVLRV